MSQDIVADALNRLMNAKKANRSVVTMEKHSKLLLSVLAIAKLKGYIKSYKVEDRSLTVELGKLNGCNAIKPRFMVKSAELEKYTKRYLPSKDLGILIVSTSSGIITHQTAQEKNVGGSLLAYFF